MEVTAAASQQASTTQTKSAQQPDPAGMITDFGQFLNLFVSQLKYQDPLSPMSGADFLAQTAQFSSVEQLVNLNKTTSETAGALDLFSRASAAGLIGRTVQGTAVGADGSDQQVSGRVVSVDYGDGGSLTLGLEDGTELPFSGVATVSAPDPTGSSSDTAPAAEGKTL